MCLDHPTVWTAVLLHQDEVESMKSILADKGEEVVTATNNEM